MEQGAAEKPEASAQASAGRPGFLAQVGLLLWKNLLLQRRKFCVTVAEILIPLFGVFIMVSLGQAVNAKGVTTPTVWDADILGRDAGFIFLKPGQHMMYAPNSTLVNRIMAQVNTLLFEHLRGSVTVMGFESEEDVIQFYQLLGEETKEKYRFTVIFDIEPSASALPPNVKYTIRPWPKTEWYTSTVFPFRQGLSPANNFSMYFWRGFVYTQRLVSEALIQEWQPGAKLNVSSLYVRRMPYPPYNENTVIKVMGDSFPTILMLSFIFSVIIMSKNIVEEKEKQLKESMKLMGMSSAAHWTSWFLLFFFYLFIASALYTIFLSVKLGSSQPLLVYSDPSLIFFFLVLYSISIIAFTFLVSTFVSKANIGAALAGILFFAAFSLFFYVSENFEQLTLNLKLSFCVSFNTAMGCGIKTISLYEGTGKGAQWDGFTEPASKHDNFSLMHAMLMLVMDTVIFFILTWYLDNVHPGTYGVPRPLYFPFQPSYWCGGGRQRRLSMHEKTEGTTGDRHFEREPSGLPAGISMVHLRKVFDNKAAVKDSTLTMYEGQITVLLGHNGAGKTTTMSMLTGFISPTSGTAYVNGYDIRTDITNVRSNLGLCPQHNILFDTLTVDEHLTFFARLKGCPQSEIPAAVAHMAKEVGLESKRSAQSHTLSGGQKRKLGVGIALIGGSKIVILDEPTAGMDPGARRQTWDILQRHCKGRTMLLSTHFMDEADVLGDRIAIMAEGVVKCCGTSLFLKKLYGAGYHLVMVKGPQCDEARVTAVIQSQVARATLESHMGSELSYLLPKEDVSLFPKLFRVIERESAELDITSFGATATTMEEVFLKVGASNAAHDDNEPSNKALTSRPKIPVSSVSSKEVVEDDSNVSGSKSVTSPSGSREGSSTEEEDDSNTVSGVGKSSDKAVSSQPVSEESSRVEEDDGSSRKRVLNQSGNASDVLGVSSSRNSDLIRSSNVSGSASMHLTNVDSGNKNRKLPGDSTGVDDRPVMDGVAGPDAHSLKAKMALDNSYSRLSGFKLNLSRFWGMFVKKAIHTRRNRIISAVQLALPVFFTILAIPSEKAKPQANNEVSLDLTLEMFDSTCSAYTSGITPTPYSLALATSYSSQFSGDDQIQAIDRKKFPKVTDFYLAQADELGLSTYNKKVVIGAQFEADGSLVNATAWYSGQPYHAMPVSLAYFMNAFVREVAGEGHRITTVNYPMPKSKEDAATDAQKQSLSGGLTIGSNLLFGMAILTASFCHFLIRERQTGAKHLQVVSGVGPLAFWVASFAWDFINYLIPCLVLLGVFAFYKVDAYTDKGNLGLVLLILVMFGIAVLPFIYILQFQYSSPATGFVNLVILEIITGLFPMIAMNILRDPSIGLKDFVETLDLVFMVLFPHYSVGIGFSNLYINHENRKYCINGPIKPPNTCQASKLKKKTNSCCKGICGKSCMPFEDNYLSWEYPGIGRNIVFMALQFAVFFLLTLAIDYQLPQKLVYLCQRQNADEDSASSEDRDVAVEKQRVDSGGADGDTLVLNRLYKQYGTFVAVNHISVGIPEQECFGLLGQNGAGKTTIFKMLTGDVMVTDGDASVWQHSVKSDIRVVQANMGYCPQFDGLIDQMTGRETLVMYARMRGVPSSNIEIIVDNLINLLMLETHADKMTMHYSGGNKRKLSMGIALVGGPAVILLDEPSTGIDPAARHHLWNVLSEVRDSGRTLVLTSHSMEECEALCTCIAIMVNGEFKCLGSPQHLKSKFGQGYTLVVKMATDDNGQLVSKEPLVSAIFSKFPGTQKFDDHQGYVHFQVPDASVPLSEVFETMESAKDTLGVEDYSVHQTTLEQIFLTFTRAQYLAVPPASSVCAKLCPCFSP
ncbi:phospholipid-transporting ATPase ABCA3-like [Babylonia areolata]|uniref:phospholipid-transporting ATPase ABCA3-like n=1 Tax=Babylonia areolata TaxID=304850 RepID=UPI003FD3DF39